MNRKTTDPHLTTDYFLHGSPIFLWFMEALHFLESKGVTQYFVAYIFYEFQNRIIRQNCFPVLWKFIIDAFFVTANQLHLLGHKKLNPKTEQ